jgi:metal-responsive CopG/Arc/MetJ family transcriptional regulator
MSATKIAVSMDPTVLARLDRLVKGRVFASRSQAVQVAVQEKMERLRHGRLARECAKVDPRAEQALAEEGIAEDVKEWPEY